MRQVFFITDDRMTALLWQGPHLISKYEFEENEISELAKYLDDSKNVVASIIVDALEEEISLTTIPHVNLNERRFLIDRTLTRLHRGAEFTTAAIIGRDDSKRRDDRLLVSGLTSSRVLTKWLDVLNQHEIVIKGIYSLPLITGNILKVLKIKKGLTLLVSRQSSNYIRQSIFKDGELFYSRNIPSSQDLNIESFSTDLQKTRKYLENQKLLSTDDRVDVLVLVSERFYQQLKGLDELLPDMDIAYVQHASLQKTLAIKSEFNIAGREIFSSLLLGSMTKNHYGRQPDLLRYKKKVRENWINYLSVAAAAILVLVTSIFYIDIEVLDHKAEGLEEQLSILKQHNDRLEKNLSKLPAKARQMKLFVDNISDVDQAAKQGMNKSLVAISQVFNAYQNISLVSLNWNMSESEYKSTTSISSRSNRRKVTGSTVKGGHVIELTAKVDLYSLNNQAAMRVVNKFLASIRNLKAVRLVTVTKQAIRASSTDNMRGVLSEKSSHQSDLSLMVFMEAENNAS